MPDELQGDILIEQTVIQGDVGIDRKDVNAPFQEARDAYQLALANGFGGTMQEWLAGLEGESVDLRLGDTHIQWKRSGSATWVDLISLASITGDDGRETEFQVTGTHIQWRYVGDASWTNLIELAAISGSNGLNADMTRSSTSSVAITGSGTKTFVFTEPSSNLGWVVGTRLRASNTTTQWVEGVVSAVSAGQVSIAADLYSGSGTKTSWSIGIAGARGADGLPGANSTVPGPAGEGYYCPMVTQNIDLYVGNSDSVFIDTGKAYSPGARIRITSINTPGVYAEGIVNAYASGILAFTIDRVPGGYFSDYYWTINLAGDVGGEGIQGMEGRGYVYSTSFDFDPNVPGSINTYGTTNCAYVPGTRVLLTDNIFPGNYIEGVLDYYDYTSGWTQITPTYWSIPTYGTYSMSMSVGASVEPITPQKINNALNTAPTSSSITDTDFVWMTDETKLNGKWVPWLSGIVTKARSYFIHLLGGQTIQSSTPTTTTLTLKAAVGQNGANPMLSIVDGGGTQVASIGHTGLISGATITTNEFRLGNRPFATQAANTLNLGSDTYWTTINYGNASTVSHVFSANTVNSSGLVQVMTIRLTSSNASPVNSGFGWSVYGTLEAGDGVVYGAGQFACLWQDAPNKLSAWEWSTRAGTILRFNDTGLGINTNNPQSQAHVVVSSQTKKGLIVQLAASPLSNAIEVQSSTGTQLFYVAANGTVSASGTIMATTGFQVAGSKAYTWDSRGVMSAPSDGVILLQNWATTDFSRLQFGGTTSAFPALKRVLAGLSVRTADDSADAPLTTGNSNVNGMLTVLGNFTGSGTDNKLPNQTAANADSIMVRRLIREEVFRMLMWSRMEYRRLVYSSAVINGTSSSASGNTGTGAAICAAGINTNGKGMALLEAGMSMQSGSGASWVIPNKFAFAGNMYSLLVPYSGNVYNITAGSNTFTYALASSTHVNMRVWSPYFPDGTYVTAVSGTTVTVSQNATGTMAGASTLTMCYMGVCRFFAAPAPINTNNTQSFCYETPQCSYTARTTAGWTAGSTSIPLNSDLYQNCNWTAGATFVTMTTNNSNIVAGMHMSGAGIAVGTTVASVSGTTINLSQPTTGSGSTYPVGFYSPNIVGMALSLTGLDPTITVTGITNNRTDGLLGAVTLSAPLPANFAGGMEIGFRNLDTLYYRGNNGIGFEWRPDPVTGICMFRIVIVRAGVPYYSSLAQFPEGASPGWQNYWQWILDYDETTLTARLFMSRQVANNSIPSVQTAPIVTLTMPAGSGIGGRRSGLQVALQCCNNNERDLTTSTANNIATLGIDYFPDRTYPY